MSAITVLVGAAGAPGAARLIHALRENGERRVRLVGTDMSDLAIGRHLCDAFHLVPPGRDPDFADALLEVCRAEGVDVVLPQSSHDQLALAEAREQFAGIGLIVSPPEAIRIANDKAETYALLDRLGLPGPAWRRVTGGRPLADAARELGYPGADVCMKPVFASGSRGFRIISASADRRAQLLEERPGNLALELEELLDVLPPEGGPELLVMELATGVERTVDGIAVAGRVPLAHAKTREAMRAGLAMYFRTLDEPDLVELARRIAAELALDSFFNIQLVGDKVIEINPRISTIVYQEDLNIPYLGVKHALGEISEEELAALRDRARPSRRALRYYDQVEWDDLS